MIIKFNQLKIKLLIIILTYLLLTSCISILKNSNLNLITLTPQITEGLRERKNFIQSFFMQGTTTNINNNFFFSVEHRISGCFPNQLRAEFIGPFEKIILLLITDGKYLTVVNYNENKIYIGSPNRTNFERFLGLPLTPNEIYSLLTGNIPVEIDNKKIFFSSQLNQALLISNNNNYGIIKNGIIFNIIDYTIYEAWFNLAEKNYKLICRFNYFNNLENKRFPQYVEFLINSYMLTINNNKLIINETLNKQIFNFFLPPKFKLKIID